MTAKKKNTAEKYTKVSVPPRATQTDEKYIKTLEESNKVLNAENRRLVNVLITQLGKREKEADKCAKCLLKGK